MSEKLRQEIKRRYGAAITKRTGCCSSGGCCGGELSEATKAVTCGLYGGQETAGLPEDLVSASFGCGNPTALAEIHPGEAVLDLGSGAGLDVLLSARRVGPYGKAYGLDMTDEMLATARLNQQKSGITNAEFLKGYIEAIPLPENAVDVIISNCVINLSADKQKALDEAFRVLKPGGRLAISDIVVTKPLPEKVRTNLIAWAGCVAGALEKEEYREKLAMAGFTDIDIVVTRVYKFSRTQAEDLIPGVSDEDYALLEGALVSAFVRAKKPARLAELGRDYKIVPADNGDLPEILKLLEQRGLTIEGVAKNINRFWVAKEHNILGVIGSEQTGKAALLRSLAVQDSSSKRGIAKALISHGLNQLRSNGVTEIYLLTTTADKYFASLGFSQVAREEIPADLLSLSCLACTCPASSVCMKISLT